MDPVVRHHLALDAHEGEPVTGVLQLRNVRRSVGELQVADLTELAIDLLVRDEALDGLIAVQRLLIQRSSGVVAVARDEFLGAPFASSLTDILQ